MNQPDPTPLTIDQLIAEYQVIRQYIQENWPMADHNAAVFARTMKIVEELGELSDEILSSMNLQRDSKLEKHTRENLEDEFADVFGSLILLAIELNIDIPTIMKRKIAYTKQRFDIKK